MVHTVGRLHLRVYLRVVHIPQGVPQGGAYTSGCTLGRDPLRRVVPVLPTKEKPLRRVVPVLLRVEGDYAQSGPCSSTRFTVGGLFVRPSFSPFCQV